MKKITYTKFLALMIAFLGAISGHGQTTLAEGDIAITGVNVDDPDAFSFVLLVDVSNGTTISFTDKSWLATGGWRLNGAGNTNAEGIVTWTATSNLSCGTEIIITDTFSNTYSSLDFAGNPVGTATETEGGFALAGGGDQVIAYQGSLTSPIFIYAVHVANNNGWTDATDNNNSAVPAGLTDGVNAMAFRRDNSIYNRSVTSNQALILNAVADATNWSGHNTTRQTLGGAIGYTCASAGSCVSTVTWNAGAWSNGTGPDLTMEAIIDDTYNTGVNGSFRACSLTINASDILTVANGTFIEVENDVTVDGEIRVTTQGNFVQNDALGTFTVNPSGTASVNKVTATKQNWLYYTYWSSPVTGETIADAFPNTDGDRRFWFNAANYIDADGNDVDDNNDDWNYALGGVVMSPGVGYAAASGRLGLYPGTDSANFIGPYNTGDISTAISFNTLNIAGSWNFIGNPYPSAIDFIAFQQANSTIIDGAAYFWSQSLPPLNTNPGNQVNNFNQNDYATFTVGSGGAAGANGIIPTQYIPSAQGFFIAGLSNGNATFTNAIRMADGTSNTQFFKNANSKKNASIVDNKIWVNLTSDNGIFNQVLMAYVDGATNGNDGMSYDAPKVLASESAILYSKIENSDKIFVIQGKAPSDLNENEIIDLGFKTSIDVPTSYTLSIAQLQGGFLNNNSVYLKDNLLDKTHNLSDSDYTFTSEVGEFNNRFKIVFTDKALSTDDINSNENSLTIIELNDNQVNFKTSNGLSIKAVTIYDLLGRQLYNFKGKNNNSETYELSSLKSTIFIAKVELSNGITVTKKAIKK